MRNVFRTCGLLAVIFIGGCVAQRVVWSPDGKLAAILGDDGLHICDVSGKLSPLLVPDAKCVAWMSDSQRVVVSTQRCFKTWQEASQAFPKDAATASKNVDAARTELLGTTHGWWMFIDETKKKLSLTNMQLALALMNLRDNSAPTTPTLATKFGHEGEEAFSEQAIVEDTLQIYSVGETGATVRAELFRQASAGTGIHSLRVSPTGKAVLISISELGTTENAQEPLKLLLVPTDGSKKCCEVGRGAGDPDWSPDGKYVIYITPADWEKNLMQVMVGILSRQQVLDDDGHYFDADHFPAREDLAGFLYNELERVRVAKDGRIFFDAAEISLPAAAKDFDLQPTIFCFDPGKQTTLTRVVPRSAAQTVGNAAQYFELSPDGRYVSIPFDDGRVSVLDIANGKAELVQPEADKSGDIGDMKLVTVPTWRTATELTFARPVLTTNDNQLVRYSVPDKKATVISTDWPAAVGDWLVEKPMAETNPAATTSPAQK